MAVATWRQQIRRKNRYCSRSPEVIVLQDVADVAKARTWLGSEDLKAAMQKSGVIGSPSIRFAA
jgi:hypothetical protein